MSTKGYCPNCGRKLKKGENHLVIQEPWPIRPVDDRALMVEEPEHRVRFYLCTARRR